jgi:hypothetical protein
VSARIAVLLLLASSTAFAEASKSRFDLTGYTRIMSRPDLGGGDGKLGYGTLHGRLMNEGPWTALELRVGLLDGNSDQQHTDLHLKIEGDGWLGGEASGGGLTRYRVTELYLRGRGIGPPGLTYKLGSMNTWFGDIGLMDRRVARLFDGAVGLTTELTRGKWLLLAGVGDAGFARRGEAYNAILNAGASLRWRTPKVLLGVGGEVRQEPLIEGKVTAPHSTPGIVYEDFLRGEVVRTFLDDNPGAEDLFTRPEARSARSWSAVLEAGFGGVGPIRWNQAYARLERFHPAGPTSETFEERTYTLYLTDLTDERYALTIANELQITLWPKKLDAAVALFFSRHWDDDNAIAPSDHDMTRYSTVLRLQSYLSERVHLLFETSYAAEVSDQGRLFRATPTSITANRAGTVDARGLEWGDLSARRTVQGKVGLIVSPAGRGIYRRPQMRLLYGAQHSNVAGAFSNRFVTLEDQSQPFDPVARSWHHLVALEAETWF